MLYRISGVLFSSTMREKLSGILFALPLTIIYALGFMTTVSLPVWVGSISTAFAVTPSRIGTVASIELAAVGLASILTASFLDTRRMKWPIVIGLAISGSMNVASAAAPSVLLFTVSRILVGLSNGFLLADINRRAAAAAVPSRIFAGQIFVMVAVAVVFFAFAPQLLAAWGPGAPFIFSAGVAVLGLLSVLWLDLVEDNPSVPTLVGRSPMSPRIIVMLLMPTALFVTHSSVWAYLGAAAAVSGIKLPQLAWLLTLGALINLLAPIASGFLSNGRITRAAAFAIALVPFAGCVYAVASSGNATLFAIGVLLQPFCVMFVVPFYLGHVVSLDPSGKAIGASAAFLMIGSAFGPSVGGAIIDGAGIAMLGIVGICLSAFILIGSIAGLAADRALSVR